MHLSEPAWLVSSSPATEKPRESGVLHRALHGLTNWGLTRWAAQRRRRRDAAVLLSFSDRELWDLGLSRSDIPRIVDGTYRRD